MKEYQLVTLDDLLKANIKIQGHMRRGRWVKPYVQQRITRGDVGGLMRKLKKTGGFSWRPWGKHQPTTGFMVGVKRGPVVASQNALDLLAWLKKERAVRDDPNKFFGGWIDTETGKIHLDISQNIVDENEAMNTGRQRKEISIWDVTNKSEIRL